MSLFVDRWLKLLRLGDWGVLFIATISVALLFPLLWQGGHAERAQVRHDGRVVAELSLSEARKFTVQGAIGPTVIEVQPGRARVLSDPGPRQYCVKQGWLTHPNSVAICAPSHVSLRLTGKQIAYDSLNY